MKIKTTFKEGDELVHKYHPDIKIKVFQFINDPLLNDKLQVKIEHSGTALTGGAFSTHSVEFIQEYFLSLKELRKQKLKLINR